MSKPAHKSHHATKISSEVWIFKQKYFYNWGNKGWSLNLKEKRKQNVQAPTY